MGRKGQQVFSGAKGSGIHLNLEKALGLAGVSDQELLGEVESVELNAAQKKARELAPNQIDVLDEISASRDTPPAARVSAAKEILAQAHGRPEARDPNKQALRDGGLNIYLVDYQVGGGARRGKIVEARPLELPEPSPDDLVLEVAEEADEF